ncbi:MAG: carboxypeptidase regulatory-like domain-containing protein [Pseudomonadota bacterium]
MNIGKLALGSILLFAVPVTAVQAGAFFSPEELIPEPSYEADANTQFTRASVDGSGNELRNSANEPYGSVFPVISQSGRYVGFTVTQGDSNQDPSLSQTQTRLKDLETGNVYTPSNQASIMLDVASNGLALYINNFLDNGKAMMVYNPLSGSSQQVNVDSSGSEISLADTPEQPYRIARITEDGRYVIFSSVNGSTDQVSLWRRDLMNGVTDLVTTFTNTTEDTPTLLISDIAPDAGTVVFLSNQPIAGSDNNEDTDVYYVEMGQSPQMVSEPGNTSSSNPVSAPAKLVSDNVVRYATNDFSIAALDQTGLPFDPQTIQQENPNNLYHTLIVEKDLDSGAIEVIAPVYIEDTDMATLDGNEFGTPTPISMSANGQYLASFMEYNGGSNQYQFAQQVFNVETGQYEMYEAGQLGVLMIATGPAFSADGSSFAFATAADDLVTGDTNSIQFQFNGETVNGLISDIYVRQAESEQGEALLDVVPNSETIDPNDVSTTQYDVSVTGDSIYGVEVSCSIVDETLLPVVSGQYGDIFDQGERLEVPQAISSNGDNWSGAMSLKAPATAVTVQDAWFATVDMSVMPTSGVATITCSGLAADINGNPIDLGSDTETITLDDGIHCLQGACTNVAGVVTYPFLGDHSGIEVSITTADGTVLTTTTGQNGEYSFESIRDGEYSVSYESPEYVQECTAVNIDEGEYAPIADKVMIAGDINNDDVIDISDFSLLAAQFGLNSGDEEFDASVDLNNDGSINIQDLVILGSHLGYNNCLPPVEEQQ